MEFLIVVIMILFIVLIINSNLHLGRVNHSPILYKDFVRASLEARYKYNLGNPVHTMLNTINDEGIFYVNTHLRPSDEFNPPSNMPKNIKDYQVLTSCKLQFYVEGIDSFNKKEKKKKIEEASERVIKEYLSTDLADGDGWRISPDWIEDRITAINNAHILESK